MDLSSFPMFHSQRQAVSFWAGYCVPRVVARFTRRLRRAGRIVEQPAFVICHPSTAKRRGWKVVAS